MKPRTGQRRRALFALVLCAVFFGLAELGARIFFAADLAAAEAPPPPPADGAPTLKGNPYLLWEQAPGVRVEHGVSANINSLGMRGPEPVIPKPKGVRRIMATGDSSVYGFRVGDEETFVEVAARLLGGAEAKIEAWNAAIPGYSTYQTINLMEMRGWKLEPDLLIIGNLWSDNNFDSFVDRDLLAAYSTFEGTTPERINQFLSHFAFYRVLHYRLLVLSGSQAEARKVGWTVGNGKQIGARRVAVNDYAANLDRLVRQALEHDAEVLFVTLANEDDLRGPRREPAAWTLYREVMRDTAERYGAPVVNVPELFYGSKKPKSELFIDEMHPTASGHAMIGAEIAHALEGWARGEKLLHGGTHAPIPVYVDTFTFGDGGQGPQPDPSKGAAQAPPQRDLQEELMTLRGTLNMTGFKGKRVQIDVIGVNASGQRGVLGGARMPTPGEFSIEVPQSTQPVSFLVYDDIEANGPSADDVRYDFSSRPLQLDGSKLMEGLVIDVDQHTVIKGP